ncbi:helix-turn-helix domain-containing protein [Citreimonas salinaria]|uniref:Putative transcriptional regulator n=1 Tax=Citreimonas salinaria TaxID=321339 RepID=A0A1H3N9U8_9RHOB|nr:type II toxin-antitoxin system MqsA family antitoxin [Citreimonas salinaria]SDY85534.1 putative transcriptional regulator [Citreimonas salinaria]
MTNAGLKEVFGRLGQVQDVDRNQSGSEESLVLRPEGATSAINAIAATRALAQCGLTLLRAKRAVEAVIAGEELTLVLPKVASRDRLVEDLAAAGLQGKFFRKRLRMKSKVEAGKWVRKVRVRAGLTQEQFAVVYGVDLKTLQKYEQCASVPAASVLSYLQMIEADPEAVKRMRIEG